MMSNTAKQILNQINTIATRTIESREKKEEAKGSFNHVFYRSLSGLEIVKGGFLQENKKLDSPESFEELKILEIAIIKKIKQPKVQKLTEWKKAEYYSRELIAKSNIHSPFIKKNLYEDDFGTKINIREKCDLQAYLIQQEELLRKNWSWQKMMKMVAEITLGLNELHRANIVHRDLSLKNILVSNDDHLMISDLDTVIEVSKDGRANKEAGVVWGASCIPDEINNAVWEEKFGHTIFLISSDENIIPKKFPDHAIILKRHNKKVFAYVIESGKIKPPFEVELSQEEEQSLTFPKEGLPSIAIFRPDNRKIFNKIYGPFPYAELDLRKGDIYGWGRIVESLLPLASTDTNEERASYYSLKSLMERSLSSDPDERPTINEIMNDFCFCYTIKNSNLNKCLTRYSNLSHFRSFNTIKENMEEDKRYYEIKQMTLEAAESQQRDVAGFFAEVELNAKRSFYSRHCYLSFNVDKGDASNLLPPDVEELVFQFKNFENKRLFIKTSMMTHDLDNVDHCNYVLFQLEIFLKQATVFINSMDDFINHLSVKKINAKYFSNIRQITIFSSDIVTKMIKEIEKEDRFIAKLLLPESKMLYPNIHLAVATTITQSCKQAVKTTKAASSSLLMNFFSLFKITKKQDEAKDKQKNMLLRRKVM